MKKKNISLILMVSLLIVVVGAIFTPQSSYAVHAEGEATGTIKWTGQGTANPQCQDGQQSYWHFILSSGGQTNIVSASLKGVFGNDKPFEASGYRQGEGDGAIHFDVLSSEPTWVKDAEATFMYTGELGNIQLVISHVECIPPSITSTPQKEQNSTQTPTVTKTLPGITQTSTPTATVGPSSTPTRTPTVGPSLTPTQTPTVTKTLPGITQTSTPTATVGPSSTPTRTPTVGPSLTPTQTPTVTKTLPGITQTSTPTATVGPSSTPTRTPTVGPSPTPTVGRSATPTVPSGDKKTGEGFTPTPQFWVFAALFILGVGVLIYNHFKRK